MQIKAPPAVIAGDRARFILDCRKLSTSVVLITATSRD
jgi:hypothetical protein